MRDMGIIALLLLTVIVGGIISYNYIEKKDNNIMAGSGLEQCPVTPNWSHSENIWVKDCGKYMQDWKKVQDKIK